MYCLVGLGNPGSQYAMTRHNVGFLCVDAVAEAYPFSAFKEKCGGLLAEGKLGNKKVFLFKPQSYMNLSGLPAQELLHFYKIPLSHVVVFHDDLDLPMGHVRVKRGGGSGGHNGLNSLDAHLTPDYWRVRVGIGRPSKPGPTPTEYVLGKFSSRDEDWLIPFLQGLCEEVTLLLGDDPQKFAQQLMKEVQHGI